MRLLLILFSAIFLAGCITTYNPSPKELKQNKLEYEKYERDHIQRDILRELQKRN